MPELASFGKWRGEPHHQSRFRNAGVVEDADGNDRRWELSLGGGAACAPASALATSPLLLPLNDLFRTQSRATGFPIQEINQTTFKLKGGTTR